MNNVLRLDLIGFGITLFLNLAGVFVFGTTYSMTARLSRETLRHAKQTWSNRGI